MTHGIVSITQLPPWYILLHARVGTLYTGAKRKQQAHEDQQGARHAADGLTPKARR